MVSDLIQRSGGKGKAQRGVTSLEEMDKLAAHTVNAHRADHCRSTQCSLFRLIEGAVVTTRNDDAARVLVDKARVRGMCAGGGASI